MYINFQVPTTKTQLKAMLAKKTAIPFHKFVCPNCHNIPQGQQWMTANETNRKYLLFFEHMWWLFSTEILIERAKV